jgi:hypothetical protein
MTDIAAAAATERAKPMTSLEAALGGSPRADFRWDLIVLWAPRLRVVLIFDMAFLLLPFREFGVCVAFLITECHIPFWKSRKISLLCSFFLKFKEMNYSNPSSSGLGKNGMTGRGAA